MHKNTFKPKKISLQNMEKQNLQTIEEICFSYRDQAERAKQASEKLKRHIARISLLRLLMFVAGVAGLIGFWEKPWIVLTGIGAITFIPFLILVKYHDRLFRRKDYLDKEAAANEQEAAALEAYDISGFEDGSEFSDPAHLYTYDLDVFGPHSLFQSVNRTCTQPGKACLARWMSKHLEKAAEIVQRQEAIRELASQQEFRQKFRIQGLLHKGQAADESELRAWAASPTQFRNRKTLRLLPCLIGGLNLACLAAVAGGILSGSTWAVIWVGCAIISFAFTGKITRMQNVYGKKLQILGTYARLLHLMDEQPMHCHLLTAVKNDIGGDSRKASLAIARLNKLMSELDQRNNYLIYTILNGSFFWELWQIMRIEAWKEAYANDLVRWLTAIGQTDALCSLATFAYNHPDYAYPTFTDTPFLLHARSLGHPLMRRDRCVRNDADIPKRPFFLIITGANMAGKSTYLRTVGINYLLACLGAPVCAESMELYPAKLITSLRTSDSLNDNTSYFFAELKRLKLIIDKLKAGEELFIILDEILKGTNSTDKQKGSMALIRQLMRLKADGIIATHDLALGTLADSFPDNIRNYSFEADIAGGELTFAYRLRAGVAQNMNACFLMTKMGIAGVED